MTTFVITIAKTHRVVNNGDRCKKLNIYKGNEQTIYTKYIRAFFLLDLGNWYYTWKLDGWNEEIGDSDALQV